MFGRKPQKTTAETVGSVVAASLRRDIAFGDLPPDSKLKIDELRARYGGSNHSVREALTLLASEGFTSLEEVAYVPAEEVADIEGFDEDMAQDAPGPCPGAS